MLRILRSSLVALVVTAPALAAQDFEGRVTATIYGGGDRPPADVVILLKSGKSRLETSMGGMPMSMIMDYSGGTITTLMAPQKMYMKMSLQEAEAGMRGMAGAGGASAELPTIKRTGKRETIAGVSCEHVVFEIKDGRQTDVCNATGMGFFGGGGGMGRGAGVPAADQLRKEFKDGFFPLKIETISGTTRTTVMQVKTVEKQAVDAAKFTVPADYTEMKMPMGRP